MQRRALEQNASDLRNTNRLPSHDFSTTSSGANTSTSIESSASGCWLLPAMAWCCCVAVRVGVGGSGSDAWDVQADDLRNADNVVDDDAGVARGATTCLCCLAEAFARRRAPALDLLASVAVVLAPFDAVAAAARRLVVGAIVDRREKHSPRSIDRVCYRCIEIR